MDYIFPLVENLTAEAEIMKLPDTVDRDEFEFSEHHGPICYFIIGGNEENRFHLNPIDHTLVVRATAFS